MTTPATFSADDQRIRLAVLHGMLRGEPPSAARVAHETGATADDVSAAFRRLAEGRAFVLMPDGASIRMAAPFSAITSDFTATIESGEYTGRSIPANCFWDALGVVVLAGARDATATNSCADCGARVGVTIRDGALVNPEGVVHFAVPAARWWEDIVFT